MVVFAVFVWIVSHCDLPALRELTGLVDRGESRTEMVAVPSLSPAALPTQE